MLRRGGLALLMLLACAGCDREAFHASGAVRSTGLSENAVRNTWESVPQGCTRDPFDNLRPPASRSLFTFVWENPAVRNEKLGNPDNAPDAPLRMEFSRDGEATLHTRLHQGVRLAAAACRDFRVTEHEGEAHAGSGRRKLAGEVHLDCVAGGNRVQADLEFRNCGY